LIGEYTRAMAVIKEKKSAADICPFMTLFPPNQTTAAMPSDVMNSMMGDDRLLYLIDFLMNV